MVLKFEITAKCDDLIFLLDPKAHTETGEGLNDFLIGAAEALGSRLEPYGWLPEFKQG